jgi:hypothetical protein
MRNLRLLVVDDVELTEDVSPDIDLVHIGDLNRVGSWKEHCESLAVEKANDFDLLSVDIVFDKDATDPSTSFLPPAAIEAIGGYNSAGLSHGMMALARRSPADRFGNLLPLAWEVRSAKSRVLDHPELRTDAVRSYGLLRALLAYPIGGETLAECVSREAREEPAPRAIQSGLSLSETFLEDLVSLPEHHGSGWGIVGRLLPSWRHNALLAVRRRDLAINGASLREVETRLRGLAPEAAREELGNLGLPISSWRGRTEYEIALGSIFGDLRRPAQARVSRLLGLPEGHELKIVHSWIASMINDGPPLLSVERLFEIASFVHAVAGNEPVRAQAWWKDADPMERCFAYCILLVRSTLLRRYVEKDDKGLAIDLGLQPTERTFLDPFKKSHFGDCTTAREFRVELRRGLRGEGRLMEVEWLRGALLRYAREFLSVDARTLAAEAPGLLKS